MSVKALAKWILTTLNRIVKKKNIILFTSFPTASDNSLTLYNYILRNRKDITARYELIWSGDETDGPEKLSCKYVKKNSFKGLMTFLRSKYVVSTHSYFSDIRSGNGQVQINLWHGCGYKTIPDTERGYKGDEFFVTSELFRGIFADIFKTDTEHVHITGLPRNDTLFHGNKSMEKLGIPGDKKKYIWMPTFRKAAKGHLETDGNVNAFGVGTITDGQFEVLNQSLIKTDSLLIIKLHPMDTLSLERIQGYSNIICLTNDMMKENHVELYEVLGETDCLLSDYSSVIVDYTLTDKPIVMVLSDFEEYKNTRGFVFDHVEDYYPGPIIKGFDELVKYLGDCDAVDEQWKARRMEIKNKFHKQHDDRSSERVCNMFWGTGQKTR